MALAEAIGVIDTFLESQSLRVFNRPLAPEQTPGPHANVYRAGIRGNRHAELVHWVMVDFHVPATADHIQDKDVDAAHSFTAAFLEWLPTAPLGMLVWWVEPVDTVDFEENDDEIMLGIRIGLCDRYPRA